MAFTQRPGALAEATDEVPVSKHQIKPTAAQVMQHGFDQQAKRFDDFTAKLTALLDAQNKQLEAQAKQLEALMQKAELQGKQIETLNADLNRLNTALLARASAPTAVSSDSAVRPATPVVQTAPPAATSDSAPATVRPDPVTGDSIAPDGSITHVVKRGETLITIARSHSTSVSELLRINKIEDERKLQIGQTLILPKGSTPQTAPPPQPSPAPQNNPQTTPQ